MHYAVVGLVHGITYVYVQLIPYLSCMRAQETAPTFVLMHGLVYVYSCSVYFAMFLTVLVLTIVKSSVQFSVV